jgi:uncharacterized Zn-finger protein
MSDKPQLLKSPPTTCRCMPATRRAAVGQHPRVFLDVLQTGEVVCPYCSAKYVFKGEAPKGHTESVAGLVWTPARH